MKITFDPAKRDKTLTERGLNFADATAIWSGKTFTFEDLRFAYPEHRYVTAGLLNGRMVIVVWTPKPDATHIISMRKANDKEQRKYLVRLS